MNDYERMAAAIRYLDENRAEQPRLEALAGHAGLSVSRFHHLFASWTGVTPKDFLQCLTLAHARELLHRGESVLDAAFDAGLSGPGRLHDLCVTLEAASPGELKSGGLGWTINAGFASTPFGRCLLAESPRGICHLAFVDDKADVTAWENFEDRWPQARIERKDSRARTIAAQIFNRPTKGNPITLRTFVRGTAFQVRVWRALLQVRPGQLVSYGRLAARISSPRATRAIGTAVGSNPIAYLIPCHRVIRETGIVGEYRWGRIRKRALLAWEFARHGEQTPHSAMPSGSNPIRRSGLVKI